MGITNVIRCLQEVPFPLLTLLLFLPYGPRGSISFACFVFVLFSFLPYGQRLLKPMGKGYRVPKPMDVEPYVRRCSQTQPF